MTASTRPPSSRPAGQPQRRSRANGVASRHAILDAAARIAGDRGYEGTSIKEVSELSGLPASSIYWHFTNKDELIAAVIERSYDGWIDALRTLNVDDTATDEGSAEESFRAGMRRSADQLAQFPDFLRLGLMLTLERRPDEPTARQRFLDTRAATLSRLQRHLARVFEGLDTTMTHRLAALILAASDGFVIAAEAEGTDLVAGFDTIAHAVFSAATAAGWSPANDRC